MSFKLMPVGLACALMILYSYSYSQRSDFSHQNFTRADSIADLYKGHSLTNARRLVNNLTQSLPSEVEKFRAIYKWVCNNIEYDYSLYLENKRKRSRLKLEELSRWNKDFNKRLFHELVEHQRTVCTGYAYLVRELCTYARIQCVIIDGYGETSTPSKNPNHSWNAVHINNKWYLCDATWASGFIDMRNLRYEKDYKDMYFLPDPTDFLRTHVPLDKTWALVKK